MTAVKLWQRSRGKFTLLVSLNGIKKNGFPDRFPSDCYDVYGHYDFGEDKEWHSTGVTILPTQTMHYYGGTPSKLP